MLLGECLTTPVVPEPRTPNDLNGIVMRRPRTGASSLVTLDVPCALSAHVMNALKADPRTVDLRALAPHFYRLGVRILELFEEEEMAEILTDVSALSFLRLNRLFAEFEVYSLSVCTATRLLKSVPWTSQTTPIICRPRWAMVLSFSDL